MIMYLIIFFSVALVGMLIDWGKLSQQLPWLKGILAIFSRKDRHRSIRTPRVQRAPHSTVNRVLPSRPVGDEEVIVDMVEPVQSVPSTPSPPRYSPEVEELLGEADVHFRKGELKAAEQLYLKVAAQDPKCSKAYSRLGVIYLETGEDYSDAEAAFRQALKSDPQNGHILNNLGLVLYYQDKFADAIRQFELAVRQDEFSASRHANLGKACMAMRQYAKAESAFKKALKLAPNEMEYKELLAEAIEKKQAHKAMVR